MPELPEVETIRRGLVRRAVGRQITKVESDGSRLFRNNVFGAKTVDDFLTGGRIAAFNRRGKFMWLLLEGQSRALVIHLGMSGQIRYHTQALGEPLAIHEHLRLYLDDGGVVSFVDPRTFGHLTLSELEERGNRQIPAALHHIAADPLEVEWEPAAVIERASQSSRHIKTLLLHQELVSGIGNIYADEGLARAALPGWARGTELGQQRWQTLLEGAAAAMREAIVAGGTSFDSLYVDTEGNPGYFRNELAVYARAGQPCHSCGTPIKRMTLDGRAHFFCPVCQRFETNI